LVWWSNPSLFSKFYCWIGVNSRTYTGGEKWYNPENVHNILNSPITEEEILRVVKNLKSNKASGYDKGNNKITELRTILQSFPKTFWISP
jgi:hypothetical protein